MAKREYRELEDGTKWKMSLQKQGSLNPTHGRPRDEATKQKISDGMKRYWADIPSKDGNKKE